MILFTKHALRKFSTLQRHGIQLTKTQVLNALRFPEKIDISRLPLYIAQITLDSKHVLRVVYKKEDNQKIIITFYPGRRTQYD